MKKILIVNKSFETGGIQSSMVNMANALSKYYEVHLFIFNPSGPMKERLNPKVRILEPSWRFHSLGTPLKDIVKTRNIKRIVFRLFAAVWTKLFDNRLPIDIAIRHQESLGNYDLAISYHQEQRKKSVVSGFARVVDRCVDAKRKVAWLHFDSDTIDLDSDFNNPYYRKMDKLVCVSRSLMENYGKAHKEFADKMDFCYNFLLYDVIKKKSLLPQEEAYPTDKFICFSACRISPEKALVRSVNALAEIFRTHPDVVWYIAGDGMERMNVQKAINENGLESQIVLIGNQPNPYAYMKNADLVLNVSYHEAAPMVFFESKALGTPAFATRTASAEELLNDKVDAFICDNSSEGIRDAFAWLIRNRQMVQQAKHNLLHFTASNDESLQKIKEYVND